MKQFEKEIKPHDPMLFDQVAHRYLTGHLKRNATMISISDAMIKVIKLADNTPLFGFTIISSYF